VPLEMNPEIRARWTAALRSGEIRQATEILNDGEGRCCLGVLCDLAVADGVIEPAVYDEVEQSWVYLDGEAQILPPVVASWAGIVAQKLIDLTNPVVTVEGEPLPSPLASLNDHGKTFAEIADLIDGGEH
jgi:hypothetical protein